MQIQSMLVVTGEATIFISNLINSIESQSAVNVIKKESQLLNVGEPDKHHFMPPVFCHLIAHYN